MSIDRYNPATSSAYRLSLESRNLNTLIQDVPYSYDVSVNKTPVPVANGRGDIDGAFFTEQHTEQRRHFDPNH